MSFYDNMRLLEALREAEIEIGRLRTELAEANQRIAQVHPVFSMRLIEERDKREKAHEQKIKGILEKLAVSESNTAIERIDPVSGQPYYIDHKGDRVRIVRDVVLK